MSGFNMGTALVLPETGDDATIRHLKQPALLFKKVAIFHLSGFMALLEKTGSEPNLQLMAELEWLLNEGIAVPFDTEFFTDYFQEFAEHFPKVIAGAIDYANAMSYFQIKWLNLRK